MPTAIAPASTKHQPRESETQPDVEPFDDSFRILSNYALCVPASDRNSGFRNPAIFGEVAHVPGKGRIARWVTRFPSGVIGFSYRTDPTEVDSRPETLHLAADEGGVVAVELEEARFTARRHLVTIDPTPFEIERDMFISQWPLVSAALGVARIKINRVFDPGPCRRPAIYFQDAGEIDFAAMRDRHVSGDFGEIGAFDPTPLTPEEQWSVGLLSRLVKNRYAIATGSGAVKSVYPLPNATKPGLALNVITALIPGRPPATLMLARPASQPL